MTTIGTPGLWVGFTLLVVATLVLDLGVLNRKAHVLRTREALRWVIVWVVLAQLFGAFIFLRAGHAKWMEFLTGYIIEYALSVDNLFVFIVLFAYFAVPAAYGDLVAGALALVTIGALRARWSLAIPLAWLVNVFGLLDLVGLGGRANHRPHELSGGEQQRVAIARALANRPPLLLADEPTGQLDSQTGRGIMVLLQHLIRSEGITSIVATHDPMLLDLADRVIELSDGLVVHDSHPDGAPS